MELANFEKCFLTMIERFGKKRRKAEGLVMGGWPTILGVKPQFTPKVNGGRGKAVWLDRVSPFPPEFTFYVP